jgi:hypothetical protein
MIPWPNFLIFCVVVLPSLARIVYDVGFRRGYELGKLEA